MQSLAGADTFRRKTGINLQMRAQFRRRGPDAGAADHVIALAQCDRCSGCSGDVLRPLGQKLQRGIQIALRHLAERFAAILAGKPERLAGPGRRSRRARRA